MVKNLSLEIEKQSDLKNNPVNQSNINHNTDDNISIFSPSSIDFSYINEDILNEKLQSIKEENGCVRNIWDKFKCLFDVGTNSEKCEETIEKYKNGEISFDDAMNEIEKYNQKQDSSLNLFSNIAASFAAIAAGTAAAAAVIATGGAAAPLVVAALAGAGAGAVTKTAFKTTDRATNEIKGDALDAKQISKDALSGAVTGAIAGATMGNGAACSTLKESVLVSAGRAAKTGVITGSVSGASNYAIECAFEDDKSFDSGEFISVTAESALVGGVVGSIMGSANGAMKSCGILKHGGMVKGSSSAIQNATNQDVVANSLCSAEYKVLNDRIRNIVS